MGRTRVVEIGCADGEAFHLLNRRFEIEYVGIEPHGPFVEESRRKYAKAPNFHIVQGRIEDNLSLIQEGSVVLALEVLEHINESNVVRIVETIAAARPSTFICSVPVEVGPAVWFKNVGSYLAGYHRHCEYRWGETFWAGLGSLDKVRTHKTGHRGFDWRWLAQTIRQNMEIEERRCFPFPFLPAPFSTSVFFVARPRTRKAGAQKAATD